jgi:hypothetical protein
MIWPDRETVPFNVSSFVYVLCDSVVGLPSSTLTQLHGQARRWTVLLVVEPLLLEQQATKIRSLEVPSLVFFCMAHEKNLPFFSSLSSPLCAVIDRNFLPRSSYSTPISPVRIKTS